MYEGKNWARGSCNDGKVGSVTFPHLPLPLLQLLDIAGNLLERPAVARDASERYLGLIRMFSEDLDTVRMIHSQHVQEEAEHGKLAARRLGWGHLLAERVQVLWLHVCCGSRTFSKSTIFLHEVPDHLERLSSSPNCAFPHVWGRIGRLTQTGEVLTAVSGQQKPQRNV